MHLVKKDLKIQVLSGDSTGIRTRVAAVRGRSLNRLTIEPGYEKRASLEALLKIGDSIENRTRVTAVKGRCLNRLTMEPFLKNRQRPTFPGSFPPSIIGAKELNYCVRDGNRCNILAIVTGFLKVFCTFKTK